MPNSNNCNKLFSWGASAPYKGEKTNNCDGWAVHFSCWQTVKRVKLCIAYSAPEEKLFVHSSNYQILAENHNSCAKNSWFCLFIVNSVNRKNENGIIRPKLSRMKWHKNAIRRAWCFQNSIVQHVFLFTEAKLCLFTLKIQYLGLRLEPCKPVLF